MWQKGFATILSLCLILVVALIVKGIHESETNHAREVSNFELEQALQSAAESGVVEAAEYVRENPNKFPYSDGTNITKKSITVSNKTFKRGEQTINITVKAWGERGKIYFYKKIFDENNVNYGKFVQVKSPCDGVYFMSRASIEKGFWGKQIYRRAYGYILSEKDGDNYIDGTELYFMELPTQDISITKKN
ncbi:MAG: hypothetical protein IJL12_08350 [Selenomonadaceae bacterium]|nr:hypothetical protein [Selenomonadaceae bacterium]